MMKLKSLALALTVTAAAIPALRAQDASDSALSWTGFYAGIQGGAAFLGGDKGRLAFDTNLDGNYNDSIAAFGNNFDGSFDSGASFGAHIGYDYQFGPFVVGALIDYSKTDITQRQSGFSSTPAFYHEERSVDALGSLRARVGYLLTPRLLAYATGGIAYADDDYRQVTNTPAAVATSGGNGDQAWVWGAGLETRITPRVSLGVEYLYYHLGEPDFVSNFSGPAAFSTVAASTNSRGSDRDFDFNMIQAKLSFRF